MIDTSFSGEVSIAEMLQSERGSQAQWLTLVTPVI
jgi:hypothetical protein